MTAAGGHPTETSRGRAQRYCGRLFHVEELKRIRALIVAEPRRNRRQLSREVCAQLEWRGPNGRLKEMSCRVAMLRMHRDGLIQLPPPVRRNGNGHTRPKITALSDPPSTLGVPVSTLTPVALRVVRTPQESALWNELIQRYHYLGYTPLPGAQLRYLIYSAQSRDGTAHPHGLLGALGFGAAAWLVAPRDRFIGWNTRQREVNLHRVINNARFLILPWVAIQNLASYVLASVAQRLPADWQEQYGYQPVLLETFVDCARFRGTCYRAANWTYVGQTTGRGKLEKNRKQVIPIKDIFLHPLTMDFRKDLCIP